MKILFVISYIVIFLVVFILLRKENYFWQEYTASDFLLAAIWPFSLLLFAIVCIINGLDWVVRKLFDR